MIARHGNLDTQDHGTSIADLFEGLVELSPREQRKRLSTIGRSDALVKQQLERLLEADRAMSDGDARLEATIAGALSSSMLKSPVQAALAGPPPELGDRYIIEDYLGEGGMGVVYRARQTTPFERSVAVKLIRPGLTDASATARFQRELVSLGRLDHPGVAAAFDAGQASDGRPFIVLEHVDGAPLTTWCDRERCGIETRLALFCDVCDAIAHAHQRGVVHRDIKASNVLVSTDENQRPTIKVIDFGVAGMVGPMRPGDPRITRIGTWVGTPGIMSPEQLRGAGQDVDTRSDVYALGMLLYELVAGIPAFDSETMQRAGMTELCRIVNEVVPSRPSTQYGQLAGGHQHDVARARGDRPSPLRRRLRGPIDWIVMRAIEKDPDRRYATVDALAADIRRHTADLPVEAGAPSAMYRVRTLVRRHRTAAATIMIAAVALSVATVIAATAAVRARHAEQKMGSALADVTTARNAERTRATQATQARDFLFETLEAATPAGSDATSIHAIGMLDAMTREILSGALASAPEVELEVHAFLGRAWERVGDTRRAIPHYAAVANDAEGRAPNTLATLRAWFDLTRMQSEEQDYVSAEPILRDIVLRADAHGPNGFRMRNDAQNVLANLLMRAGRIDESIDLQYVVLQNATEQYGRDNPLTAGARFNLGGVLAKHGRIDEAEVCYRESLAIFEEHGLWLTTRVRCRAELGWRILDTQDKHDEAIAEIQTALANARDWLGDGHAETRSTAGSLRAVLLSAGQLEASLEQARENYDVNIEHAPHDHRGRAAAAFWRAWSAWQAGYDEEAWDVLPVAIEALDRIADEPDPNELRFRMAWSNARLTAEMAIVNGRPDAEEHLDYAEKMHLESPLTTTAARQSRRRGALDRLRADLLGTQGRWDEAVIILEDSLPVIERDCRGDWWNHQTRCSLARALFEVGRLEDSREVAQTAVDALTHLYGPDIRYVRDTVSLISRIDSLRGN